MTTTDAKAFVTWMQVNNRVPDTTDVELLKHLNIVQFMYTRSPFGHYKLSSVDFEDESSWEQGKVYE